MMLTWAEAADAGAAVCGGKGYQLGLLARYGFRVPDGGVLPAEAHRLTGQRAALPNSVRTSVCDFLERHGLIDVPVAVRSSATAEDSARASFAGIHRSLLNVRGIDAIEQAILTCYASLETEQARTYRARMGLADEAVACAVVICRMVEPVSAGVAFSADPVTGRRDLIVIESAPGLGEAVVSGTVDPQRFVFRVECGQPVLEGAPPEMEELARTVDRIHWVLGDGQDPQDVEWAYDGRRLWVLQSRPITRLPRVGPPALRALPQYWSTANVKDSAPGVLCELSWSSLQALVDTVAFAPLAVSGYQAPAGAQLMRRFQGRAYFDFTLLQWAFHDCFGIPADAFARTLGGHQPRIETPPGNPLKGPDGSRRRKASLRLLRALWGFEKKQEPVFRRHIAEMQALARENLDSKSQGELRECVDILEAKQFQAGQLSGMASAAPGRWLQPLEGLIDRSKVASLSTGSGEVTSAEVGYRIADLAQHVRQHGEDATFQRALDAFLDEFGYRAAEESDGAKPRWIEDPQPLLRLIRELSARGSTADARAAARERRAAAEHEIRSKKPLLWPLIRWMARGLRRGYAIRELGKSALIAAILPCRNIVLEVGRRMVASGLLDRKEQALELTGRDVRDWLDGFWDGRGARELTEDRRLRHEAWRHEEIQEVIAGEEGVTVPAPPAQLPADGVWRGIAASAGRAVGIARVVRSPEEGGELGQGDILIAPNTHPGWTPLFLRASAVVMETGGYLSHGSIVAREYGLPAVVNIPGLLRQLSSGERVTVDGDEGTVARAASYTAGAISTSASSPG